MTERTVKNWLGLFLIGSHLAIVTILLAEFFAGGYAFRDMTTAVAIVAPMFTAYTAVIIKYFMDNRAASADTSARLAGPAIALTFAIPAIFVVVVVASIVMFGANIGFENFEQLKGVLVIAEAGYGFYLSKIVEALFPKGGPAPRSRPVVSRAEPASKRAPQVHQHPRAEPS